ncbi:MAG: aminotransferase class IV [Phycisphaerales bacterium]|nr:aminotransferase class IV [Phycisphaerales bacterium]
MPTVYLNGQFISPDEARISVFDRGFLFGDAVYEVIRYFNGRPYAMDLHVQRLQRTLREVRFGHFEAAEIVRLGEELLARNDLRDACVYWQITRGTGQGRSHLPPADLRPTVFGCVDRTPPLSECATPAETTAALHEDWRWARCDIKSTNLLPNILGKIAATDAGAQEVIFHRGGRVSEGGSTTVLIARGGQLITPPIDDPDLSILHGVTRRAIAALPNVNLIERPLTVEELRRADEIILAGTRTLLAAVVSLDGRKVGDGRAGPAVGRLLTAFVGSIRAATH